MALVVTGLSQNGDISALHKALADAGLATDGLQAIGPNEASQGLSRGLAGADLLVSDSGTGVPGLTNVHQSRQFFRNESLWDRIGDLEIPESELDNYVEAVERGRTVVGYFAHADNADKVEEIFKTSGLLNVRRF